ncbi:unnamed protein product [Adineta steineri]|uniref:Uncharacterized protein n=1 Tax=Adineta steineri TaxID=433720 RepID=A0A819KAV0_9BILA|nr:unnamed protein product [Adineta steineri]
MGPHVHTKSSDAIPKTEPGQKQQTETGQVKIQVEGKKPVVEDDSTSSVKDETENNEASSSMRSLRSKFQSLATTDKPKSVCATTTDTEVLSIQYARIKKQTEGRINKHYQGEEEVDINGLLASLQKPSATPNSGKLLGTLYGRHLPQPRFLTVQDFDDGSLVHKGLTNEPVVYAVTICIPRRIYNCIKKDPKLRKRKVVRTAWIDYMKFAHLRGKIGQLGSIFCYLRQKARESTTGHFPNWVKVWPILSGKGMEDLDKRIQMETLCSFLLGRAGNNGYNFVGRVGNRIAQEMRAIAKRLNECMDKLIVGKNGLPITLRKIARLETIEGRIKVKPREDGLDRDAYQQGAATKYGNDSPEAIAEINAFVNRRKLAKKTGYIASKTFQYRWEATCPECHRLYCVTKINKNKPNFLAPPRCNNRDEHVSKTQLYLTANNGVLKKYVKQ